MRKILTILVRKLSHFDLVFQTVDELKATLAPIIYDLMDERFGRVQERDTLLERFITATEVSFCKYKQ